MGGIDIDLREVEFTAPQLTIRCAAIMGGIDITVPPDVTVEVNGLAVMAVSAAKPQVWALPARRWS